MELKKEDFQEYCANPVFTLLKGLLKNKLIHNLFIFISSSKLEKTEKILLRISNLRFRRKEKIKVNLSGDKLYKLSIK